MSKELFFSSTRLRDKILKVFDCISFLHSFVVAFKTEREREKGQQMNAYGTMHPTRKERRKHVLWIQMKIFATEKLLLVSAAVTFFIFLFEVVIEASRGIRWEKKVFAAASILGPKQIFTSQFLTPIVKLSFGKKNVGICKSSQMRLNLAPLLNVF